ncbi:MAG TPA: hypothetical protein PL048_14025 [Leptospiraceae bacterium]|nr:hypothetical protein [Leptospiraceae bacterium]HMY68024.1 hypothetical protein [Leptospiraceae bacterium]HMZ59892.1 hypothetical protein [Leptospiraceae bacterium]HNF16697.1 hypothetical protein [Leptospiraceae bacterium]HNF26226.1 hypothetical protein [Leptospiraceae bacterium]
MNVKDLYSIYESINEDIDSLKQTIHKIPQEREYSEVLQKSIHLEIEKYENLKGLILDIEIDLPTNLAGNKLISNPDDTSYFFMP